MIARLAPTPLRALPALLLIAAQAGCHAGPAAAPAPDAARALFVSTVTALCAPEMEGRGVATQGNMRAVEYVERAFQEAGLQPGAPDGSFRQCFSQPVAVRAARSALLLDGAALPEHAVAPAPFSASAAFEGEVWFAGYGIHAPSLGYDDYASLEAKDKVLLLLRYEPREQDPKSPFDGERPSAHSDLRRKVFEARERGARAVLFVSPPRAGDEPDRRVLGLEGALPESSAGLPVLHVLPAEADRWLVAQGSSLAAEVAAIDRDMRSRPLRLGAARGEVALEREERSLCNVVGRLPGEGALAAEAVVIGAHLDHLGFGQAGSMKPGERVLHPGADDNASGVAGLVVLARRFAASPWTGPRRALLLVAFNAEEVGMVGSSRYVEAPSLPLEKTQAMINLDMIGRLQGKSLVVLGAESGDRFQEWLADAAKPAGLTISGQGDGYGPSDQTPFYAARVPVLHFFTGAHEDHHQPSDTPDKLDVNGAMQVLEAVAEVTRRAATDPARVAYRTAKAGPLSAGDSRSFNSWLGTVPDFSAMSPGAGGGVKIGGIRPGGPAERAGLLTGDVLVSLAGRKVDNLYDMTFVLRDHRPGEVVEVVVLRGGQRLTLAATLGSRAEMGKGGHPGMPPPEAGGPPMDPKTLLYPGEERHLRNLRQLTFGGENAEGYFSPDGKRLVFQARGEGVPCDRIYTLELATGRIEQISSGAGRTTCSYFTYPDGEAIFYSSTHEAGPECPPAPDHSQGHVWPVFESYDIYLRKADGTLQNLTHTPGYDAEGTACFKDGRIVFTSDRDGDLDLYLMDPRRPGEPAKRLTNTPGYDGGAYFSPDCTKLTWRAARPEGQELADYRALLARHLVKPSRLEIYVADADGKNARQVTRLGVASFSPYFLPDNRRVIFASNKESPNSRNFDLYVVDPAAAEPDKSIERITFSPVFESFPMFSPDGRFLVFASNRNQKKAGDTNLFIAEWVE